MSYGIHKSPRVLFPTRYLLFLQPGASVGQRSFCPGRSKLADIGNKSHDSSWNGGFSKGPVSVGSYCDVWRELIE